MTRPVWDSLLDNLRDAHQTHSDARSFCNFPTDLTQCPVEAFRVPAARLMENDRRLLTNRYAALRDAFVAASPHAHWRETYKDTGIGDDFMSRFGCYCLVGPNGAFVSATMQAYVVYMPAGLWYPWHHHPAEEMYLVLAGQGEFLREGEEPETLRPGDTSFHASNQSHATRTHKHPMMACVFWRNEFDTPPVLTPPEFLNGRARE